MAVHDGGARLMNLKIEGETLHDRAVPGSAEGCERVDGETYQDPPRLFFARTVVGRLSRLAVQSVSEQCSAPGRKASPSPTSRTTSPSSAGPPQMAPKKGREHSFGDQRQHLQEDEEHSEQSPQTRQSSGGVSSTSTWDQEFPPMPAADTFCEVPLRVNFRALQEADKYVIFADVRGLSMEEASITLKAKGRALRVAGCCHPAPNRAEQLRDRLDARLRHLAQCSPERHQRLLTEMERPETVAGLYAELGRDEFGCFVEAFQLPPDADARKVSATYDGCTVRIVVAKAV